MVKIVSGCRSIALECKDLADAQRLLASEVWLKGAHIEVRCRGCEGSGMVPAESGTASCALCEGFGWVIS